MTQTQYLRTDNQTKRILSVTFTRETDTNPDLSHLGEYSNTPGPSAIDRQERGHMLRGEYRYFNPAMSGEESGNPDSPEQDYQRMEDYERCEWCMQFCRAKAKVSIRGVEQKLTSGGLGGVESDSEEEYFDLIRDEELVTLRGILEDAGFTTEQINAAFRDVEDD